MIHAGAILARSTTKQNRTSLIPPDFIDEVLARTDIVEVVESRVDLKKTGQNYSGLCPFHTEKSPSFTVNREKQFFYCFGCQASGSAIKFVMEFDRTDFIETIEMLAARLGLEVPKSDSVESTERHLARKSIYNILDQSADFFQEQLRKHTGRDIAVSYLKGRGLSGEIARDFRLGYAPPGWDNLYTRIAKTNHERQLLIDAGMLIEKQGDASSRVYDRFRDRVMFPIRDLRGRVIAFGGRIIGDGKPKYLNSPETPVFHKGRELYGLYEARKRNRKLEFLLVVEGYMDVVALAQHGVNCAVATLGTATTREHLDRLYRMVPKIIFCFDGDTAGRNAGWKALLIALSLMNDGRSARFLFVPDGEDPDSLIRKEGQDKFEWRMDQAQHLPDFFFEKLQSEVDFDSLDGKAHLSKLAMPLIMKIPNGVFRELMIGRLGELTSISSEKLLVLAGSAASAIGSANGITSTDMSGVTRQKTSSADESTAGGNESPIFEAWHEYSPDEYNESQLDDYPGMMQDIPSELANKAISLLLRQPELAGDVDEKAYRQLESARGCSLLLELVRSILVEDIRSPVLLLAKYQDRKEFPQLKQLAELEQLLGVSELPEEYGGVLRNLRDKYEKESDEQRKRNLLSKPFSELSLEEKQQLRALTSRQNR